MANNQDAYEILMNRKVNSITHLPQHHRAMLGVLLCTSTLVLTACGGGDADDSGGGTTPNPPQTSVATVIPPSKAPRIFHLPDTTGEIKANAVTIQSVGAPKGTQQSFQLNLPADADAKTLRVKLNGVDVTGQFSSAACRNGNGSSCMQGTLGTNPGAKHVLTATVGYSSGQKSSGRLRFKGASTTTALGAKADDSGCSKLGVPCPEAFIPPTVAFSTLQPGGWDAGAGAWFQIAGTKYPSNPAPAACGSVNAAYVAVVLNRQSLVEESNSPQCFTNSSDFNAFLKTVATSDIVVGGTTPDVASDTSAIDATPVGGSKMGWTTPQGYMVIGAGGQGGGAYEPFNLAGNSKDLVSATGTLQEDANGNYNFQPSEVVQFASAPLDPAQLSTAHTNAFAITIPPSLASSFPAGVTQLVFTTPAGSNGTWLLQLDRMTLKPPAGCTGQTIGNTIQYASCGTFFGTDDASWGSLGAALSPGNAFVLNVLQTVGSPGVVTGGSGWEAFYKAAMSSGITPTLLAQPQTGAGASYSYVGYSVGNGNALTGAVAESSSVLKPQGQTGFMRGILQRNNYGLFQVAQVSQEPQVVFAATGGLGSPDFALTTASYQQPVAWPSSDSTKLLPGATDLDQQISAYRFISHWLLAGYYMEGITGDHQDDLHYFFSGSTNTSINYHTMDPRNLPFPTVGSYDDFGCDAGHDSGVCYFFPPGDSSSLGEAHFDEATFNAVKNQMHLEVLYLTNALQFLSTGSANLKDVIASGQANAGLALQTAASTILGSKLLNDSVPTSQPVTFSWQSVLNLVGSIASTIADAEGLGELTEVWNTLDAATQKEVKSAVGIANTLGATLSIATNASSLTSGGAGPTLPTAFATFATTIGQLGQGQLQDTLIVGFDVMSDNITSDWGRLSAIGPMVVDTNNPVFFAPTQTSQINTLQALTAGAGQGFYMALMPVFYQVHYWPQVHYSYTDQASVFGPDMGVLQGGSNDEQCYGFYVNPNNWHDAPYGQVGTLPTTSGIWTKAMMASNNGDGFGQDYGSYDVLTIDIGKGGSPVPTITADLGDALFAPNQLNIPMLQFVAQNGPMASVWIDARYDNPAGASRDKVCDADAYGR